MPFFSVILATRNRPDLFAEALGSVLVQDRGDLEVVVVDDGSNLMDRRRYEAVLTATSLAGDRLKAYWLTPRPNGHGPSYVRNFGVSRAIGDYICFLDDDDCWTDAGHLARAARAIGTGAADIYMANQVAYQDGVPTPGPTWIEGLAQVAAKRGTSLRADGSMTITVDDLVSMGGFCHLNTLVVRRALYVEIGGMDESLRWEEDRDLFLRLIDRAGTILHHPAVVARHNIPDPSQGASMTTSLAMLDRWLYQLRVLDKAALFARHPAIRAHAMQHKAYTLKRIAEHLRDRRQWKAAAYYARQALGAGPTLKWRAFTLYCGAMARLGSGEGAAG